MNSLAVPEGVTQGAGSDSKHALHLGGPGAPDRALRDVLVARIRAIPRGGRIAWVTYYFRDRALARELLAAHERGVDVCVLLEGRTRTRGANRHVLALLGSALGTKLRVVDRPYALRVHAKIYAFDGAEKTALIGSFNPSGDDPELEPRVLEEIGDQDRGFNELVETRDDALVDWLFAQMPRLHASWFARVGRFPLASPQSFARAGETFWLLPRFAPSPLLERLGALPAGARVRLTATHLSGRIALRHLAALAARGVAVEALGESTERRVPRALEARLRTAGVAFTRISGTEPVSMHAKFMLIEAAGEREVWFGSANWSDRSFQRNFEALACSRDAALFDAFASYWGRIERFALGIGEVR